MRTHGLGFVLLELGRACSEGRGLRLRCSRHSALRYDSYEVVLGDVSQMGDVEKCKEPNSNED